MQLPVARGHADRLSARVLDSTRAWVESPSWAPGPNPGGCRHTDPRAGERTAPLGAGRRSAPGVGRPARPWGGPDGLLAPPRAAAGRSQAAPVTDLLAG